MQFKMTTIEHRKKITFFCRKISRFLDNALRLSVFFKLDNKIFKILNDETDCSYTATIITENKYRKPLNKRLGLSY